MISNEVINAMIDLIEENLRLIKEIRMQGFEYQAVCQHDIEIYFLKTQGAIYEND